MLAESSFALRERGFHLVAADITTQDAWTALAEIVSVTELQRRDKLATEYAGVDLKASAKQKAKFLSEIRADATLKRLRDHAPSLASSPQQLLVDRKLRIADVISLCPVRAASQSPSVSETVRVTRKEVCGVVGRTEVVVY